MTRMITNEDCANFKKNWIAGALAAQHEELRDKILCICRDHAIAVEAMRIASYGWALDFLTREDYERALFWFAASTTLDARPQPGHTLTIAVEPKALTAHSKPVKAKAKTDRVKVSKPVQSTRLTDRELASILAGLRLLQGEAHGPIDGEAIDEIATDHGHLLALSDGEIDQLCERLNHGTK